MKIKRVVLWILVLMTMSLSLNASAAVFTEKGTLENRQYTNGSFSCTLPEGFKIVYFDEDRQAVVFEGKEDANGFIPTLTIYVGERLLALDELTEADEKAFIQQAYEGTNILKMQDATEKMGETEVHRFLHLYNTPDGRMNMSLSIYANIGEEHAVEITYQGYTATRSAPDDLRALEELLNSIAFGE